MHHHHQGDSQQCPEEMSFDAKLPNLSKKKQFLDSCDEEEDSQGDVQADFEFFDPKPRDFNGVKILLKNYLDDKGVGFEQYKENQCFREVKEFLLKVCLEKNVASSDLELMFEKKAQDVGLLVSQRVMNLPPLYDGLFDEVSWARGASKLIPLQLKNPKQRKRRHGEEDDEETIFLKPEDELFLELLVFHIPYALTARDFSRNEELSELMGLVMAVEAIKIPVFRQMLNSLIDE
ncbi:hypothetical protein Bca101_002542 [Brassica carinata]